MIKRFIKIEDFAIDGGSGEGDAIIKSDRNSVGYLQNVLNGKTWDLIYDFACVHPKDSINAVKLFENKVKQYIVISSQSVYDEGRILQQKPFVPMPTRI